MLGGSGWQDKVIPGNVRYAGHVYTHEHNAFNSSALAILNVNRESMAKAGYSPATRVFEAAGAGACMVSDAWEGIEQFFEPGLEILVAKDTEEVVRHLLTLTPERCRTIGAAARRRVLAEHTYAQRAREVELALAATRLDLAS
jgi:spore maturation protein CgeB